MITMEKATYLLLLTTIHVINGSVLLWGPKQLEIPSLKVFDNSDLDRLLQSLQEPHLIGIEINTDTIPNNIQGLLDNKYSAFIPNAELNIPDKIVLTQDNVVDYELIENTVKEKENIYGPNVLGLIIFRPSNLRPRRDAEESTTSSTTFGPDETAPSTFQINRNDEPPSGPMLYSADGKAMLYSGKPLIFKSNDTSDIVLGRASFVSMDNRESFQRLIVTIPIGDAKVTLRFRFTWLSGYWTLASVEVEIINSAKRVYQLISDQDMTAPRDFSYHCSGTTVFTDGENSLHLYEFQVQPVVTDGRFNDAYDCVPFTTAPIWSGLLVTSILGLGLALGLTALGSIKTMDKFDNQKTKQLPITVSD